MSALHKRLDQASGQRANRHTRFSLDNGNLSAGSPFRVKLPDLAARQRVPSIMNHNFLDMGRMAPQLL